MHGQVMAGPSVRVVQQSLTPRSCSPINQSVCLLMWTSTINYQCTGSTGWIVGWAFRECFLRGFSRAFSTLILL